jgi:hypothetical protein
VGYDFLSIFCLSSPAGSRPARKTALRLTARGFTNLRGGHDACASAFSKRSDRRAGCRRPSDDQREERSVKPMLGGVLVWGFKSKGQGCSLMSLCFNGFSLFNVYDLARGPHSRSRPCHGRQGREHLVYMQSQVETFPFDALFCRFEMLG